MNGTLHPVLEKLNKLKCDLFFAYVFKNVCFLNVYFVKKEKKLFLYFMDKLENIELQYPVQLKARKYLSQVMPGFVRSFTHNICHEI